MKKISIIVLILFSINAVAQTGKLIPDTLNAKIDTIYFRGILHWDFSKGAATKTDSGFAVVKTAPMVFVGANNSKAKTDQTTTLEEKWFTLPKKTAIEVKNIISAFRKD